MESLSISSRRTPLPHHLAFRRIHLAPADRRLHFPRPSVPQHYTVRCSHKPLPKEREVKKKGRWKVAAAGVAVAVACTLGAVYLSRAAPEPLPDRRPGTVTYDVEIEGDSDENDKSPEKNPVLGRTRDEVRKILFEKETCSAPHLIDSWMKDPTRIDAALMVVQWQIAKKEYHAAEEICERIRQQQGSTADARPRLLVVLSDSYKAVIKMMLAVEAMLKPETGEKDLEVFIDSAMESWKEFHESIHR